MARIRTVKPDLARHEGLYALEVETGWPMRFVWALLPTVCDREGRFRWRPNVIKLDILPYDSIDFERVLDALVTRGFLVRYAWNNELFGWIPTFRKHQSINNKEQPSYLPSPDDADDVVNHNNQPFADALTTRDSRDENACPVSLKSPQGEGKGREVKRLGPPDGGPPQNAYSSDFSHVMEVYPKRNGSQRWGEAWSAWQQRLKEGHTAEQLTDGVNRYAAHIEGNGNVGTEYVAQAATFFGRKNKLFAEDWPVPDPKPKGGF